MPRISSEVKVRGDLTDEQLAAVKCLVHYSPVHGMNEYANKVESHVTRA
jgi:hypothetical protein